jgi:hypothetical protein
LAALLGATVEDVSEPSFERGVGLLGVAVAVEHVRIHAQRDGRVGVAELPGVRRFATYALDACKGNP